MQQRHTRITDARKADSLPSLAEFFSSSGADVKKAAKGTKRVLNVHTVADRLIRIFDMLCQLASLHDHIGHWQGARLSSDCGNDCLKESRLQNTSIAAHSLGGKILLPLPIWN
jgi:hypothetical protein